jgi:hypothetical protein
VPSPELIKQLSDMKIDEISLVDRGANQHAKVLISKRADEEDVDKASPTVSSLHHDMPLGERAKRKKRFANRKDDDVTVSDDEEDELAKADFDDELLELLERLAQRRGSQQQEGEGEEDDTEDFDEEVSFAEQDDIESFQSKPGEDPEFEPDEGPGHVRDPHGPEDEFSPDEGGEEDRGDKLPAESEAEDEPKPMPGDLPEEVAEYIGELERVVEELERRFEEEAREEVGKTDAHKEVDNVDDVKKTESEEDVTKASTADADLTKEEVSFLEELTKSFEEGEVEADEVISKALEEVRKAQAEAAEATALAKAERELRVTREYISKVEEEYPHLPVAAAELGAVLKSAKDALDEEQFSVLEKALAANEAIARAIEDGDVTPFSEVGKRGGANPAGGGEIESQADEMVAKGEAKTREEAIAKLYEARPELYDEYLRDNEAQVR